MKMKFNKSDIIVLSIILLFLTLLAWGSYEWKINPQIIEKETIKIDTITVVDTVKIIEPQATIIRTVDKVYYDTIIIDSEPLEVPLQVEEKVYDDSLYHIVISGVHPNLDTLELYQPSIIINKEVTKYKNKRFNHGLQIGLGYGLINNKPDVYIGYGFQIIF